MSVVVMVGYKPKIGQEENLRRLMRSHLPRLREQGLVTNRESILAEAADGTVVEIFEWKSQKHIDAAHENPEVLKMWAEYDKVCNYIPLQNLAEFRELFAAFKPIS